jgi:hypothetical protein
MVMLLKPLSVTRPVSNRSTGGGVKGGVKAAERGHSGSASHRLR